MGVALVTLPDGLKARVTFDTPDQLDATVDDLVHQHSVHPLSERMSDNPLTRGVGEAGLQAVSGMAGAAAGGVLGAARGAGAGIASLAMGEGAGKATDAFADEATRTIESTERAMAYQPRTAEGKAVSEAVAAPFTWLARKADVAGEAVSGAVKSGAQSLGASEETAGRLGAGAGAVTNTALQAAPAAVTGGIGRLAGLEGLAARVEPTLEPSQPRAAPFEPQDQSGPAQPAPPANPLEAKAAAYARTIGLDWTKLGAGTRRALTTIAQDATALRNLDPAAVRRQALLDSQRVPVPATRGQLTRNPAELRREAIVSRTDAGQPIRDVDIQANRAVQANLEALRGRAAGLKGGLHDPVSEEGVPATEPSIRAPTKLPSQVGEAAQSAVREKAKWSKKGYEALFKRARETEPTARASLAPVTDLLTQNPDIQHLGWVQSWLNRAAKTKAPSGGEPVAMTDATLAELHDLRSTATEIARTGGKEGLYAGKVVGAIDKAMQDVPAGAKAWTEAIDAFKKHQREFKDQDTVRQLTSRTKSGGNPALALEKTWQKLAKGPVENLRQVKRTMLTGGTPKIREMGRRAFRDLRGETINRILEDARNVVATDETEREILTAAALQKGIRSIPRENLEELIGRRNVRELNDILRTAKITRTQPSARVTESGTVPNMLVMAEKILGHIPGGKYVVGAAKVAKKIGEAGKAGDTVRRATTSPLDDAAQRVKGSAKRTRRQTLYQSLESTSLPDPTIGELNKPP